MAINKATCKVPVVEPVRNTKRVRQMNAHLVILPIIIDDS